MLAQHLPSLAFDRAQLVPSAEEQEATRLFPPVDQRVGCLFFDRRAPDALVSKILDRCETSYESITQTADGVPVLHVLIPCRWHTDQAAWREKLVDMDLDPSEHVFGMAQRRIAGLLKGLGHPTIDLTAGFTAHPNQAGLWFRADPHLSAAGCDQVAEWLAPRVRQILAR